MKPFRSLRLILLSCLGVVVFPAVLWANQSAVRLEVPAEAKPGTEIVVRVFVTHEGNNFFHYTDWVYVAVGDKEIGRWDFSATHRPENENFVREVTYKVQETTTFRAQANCNIHGSAGPDEATVRVGVPKAAGRLPKEGGPGNTLPPGGRRGLGRVVLLLGIANLILVGFQVASGRRWIRVKIAVHRRAGQTLSILALIHGVLAILVR